MNTRQLLAIEYLNQFGEDIIFKNMEIVMITELYDI
ncbi:hypothetical protein SMU36_04426 [Streptococcus mutans 4VF1]|nr:hypothetical protein SMU36_04426 [Streptococcus mutans 4VF1]